MTKSRIFLVLALSFIGGIAIRSFTEADFFFWEYLFLIISIGLLTLFHRIRKIALLSASILFLLLGVWRMDKALQKTKTSDLDGKQFLGSVRVIREPEMKGGYVRVIAETLPERIRIIFNAGVHSGLRYGDELEINCQLETPQNKKDDFNYRMYLAKDGISYECQKAQIEKTGNNSGNPVYRTILGIKGRLSRNIDQLIPQPEGTLAKGIIFGGSQEFPEAVADNFSRTGMTHVVAVSGYNVTIIAEYLIWFFILIGLWRQQAFWLAIVGITLFVLMVGAPASAVRAGVMGGLLLWAMKNGRLANSNNAILFSASVMLFTNPLLLRYDIGFQLSFLATLGIVWLAPFFERFVFREYNWLDWQGTIFLTLSAQIFVAPLIMYHFHTFSVVSLLANLLVLPIIPLAMLLAFITSLVGLMSLNLAMPLAWLAFLPLKYAVTIINFLGSLEWASLDWTRRASLETADFRWLWLVGWYAALFSAIFYLKHKSSFRQKDAE